MFVATGEPSKRNVNVRFDVLGWTGAENDAHEGDLERMRSYCSTAIDTGLNTLDIAEYLLAFNGIFERVSVTREDRGPNIILSILAIASGHGDKYSSDFREVAAVSRMFG